NYSNPSANSYSWVVPNTPGTQCEVGVFNTSFQGDVSDNFFTITTATNVEELRPETFSVYPNPVTNELVVGNSKFGDESELIILNAFGEQVCKTIWTSNVVRQRINVSVFPSEIYFVKVFGESEVQVASFVKQ